MRESQHDHLVSVLAELGVKTCSVFVDIAGWRDSWNKVPRNLVDNPERVREIDVLWFDDESIIAEFEVENTTGITEAIVRGSNILDKTCKRFIVIPEERHEKFLNKMDEPLLREKAGEYNWTMLYYDSVTELFDKVKTRKTFDKAALFELAKTPKIKKLAAQESMEKYMG